MRYEVKCAGFTDLSREVIKSETASIAIPEIDLDMEAGTLGGRFSI